MKTVLNLKNIKVMKNYMKNVVNRAFLAKKYICAFVLLMEMSVNAWGTTCTLYGGLNGATTINTITNGQTIPACSTAGGSWDIATNWESKTYWTTTKYSASSPTTTKPSGSYLYMSGDVLPDGITALYAVYVLDGTYYSGAPGYQVNLDPTTGDSYAEASKYMAIQPGTSVTITAHPDDGKVVTDWSVLDGGGDDITPTSTTSTTFVFTMPSSDVTAEVSFGDPCTSRTVTFAYNITKDFGTAPGKYQDYTLSAGSGTVTWSSDDDDIASVNSSGVVTLNKAGWTYINVEVAEDGTYCAVSDWYKITVNEVTPTLSSTASGKELTVSGITAHGATFSGGVVTFKGNATVNSYGYIVGTSSDVTYATRVTQAGTNDDVDLNTAFGSKSVTGLTPGTTYYVRPIANNKTQIGYGTAVSFTTLAEYDIVLDKNNSDVGSEDGAATVVENATSIEIDAPTRTGYAIEGYYTTDGLATKVATAAGALQSGITVSATNWTNGSSQWVKAGGATFYTKWTANNYTVTFNQNGGSGGSENVTATFGSAMPAATMPTTPPTGKTFDGYWYNSVQYYDASGNSVHAWDVDDDVTLVASWTTATPTMTIAEVDHIVISSTSPSKAEGQSTTVAYNTTVTLSHGEPASGYYWLGWNVYETGNEGNTVTVTDNQFLMPDHDVTVSANLYTDLVFSCAELTLTPKLVTASTPIFITSMASKTVRSADSILVVGSGLTPNAAITFTTGDSRFEVKSRKYGDFTVKADGTIDTVAYIFYTPAADATIDGLDEISGITASVGGAKPITKSLSQSIIGRHVPANFVIAVKNGASWYALPANMTTSTPAPEPIVVDNNSSPTMAYTSDDNIFTLYGQHNSFMTTGGEYIKLAMHGQSNAPMAAADGTGSKIGKSIAINIENNIGNDYWWLLTQTNTSVSATTDVKYNVTIGNSNTKFLRMWPAASGGAKWGMYAYGINEIRLIPATAVTEMDLDVFEWGTEDIVVKYNGSGTLDGANVAGTNASSAELVDMPGDLKKITNLAGLSSNPSGLLAIRINDGGVKQALLPIPFIITGTKTDAEVLAMVSDDAQAAAGTDVVILNGGYLKQSSERTFNNIHIYGGGKDSVGNNLTTQNIYLHGGFSWLTNSFALPQMKVKDGVNIVSPEAGDTIRGIYYDLTLNNSMYYVTALPKTVAVADITNEEGTQKFSAWMKRYSGKGRTLSPKESGWIRHGETAGDSIKRGIGYEIAIKPRKSRSYGILRFPLLKDTIWSDETNCAPPIVGWGYSNDAVAANNKGWNLLGNPFFSAYNNTTEDATRIEQRGLVQHKEGGAWTGTYDFNESTVRYFTIPNYTDEDYRDVRANPYKLDAFYPFFVQAKVGTEAEPGSLSFGASGRALKAPSILRKHILDREIIVDFMLRDENDHTDAAGLTINNEYTDEFDMDDKEKTIENGTQFMKVYTIMDGHRIAFNALPEETAQGLIPVGYIAPSSGTYTFTLPQGDYPELAHLWLIDNELNTQTDLLLEEYDFQTDAGQNDTRFTINLALSDHKTPTDIENVDGGDNGHKVNLPEKFIYQDNLYIRHNGILYDGTGKRIR